MMAKGAHVVHMPPHESSTHTLVPRGPTPWHAIVITHPAPTDHTQTWQHRWGDMLEDLLEEQLGLTRTQNTLERQRNRPGAARRTHCGVMGIHHVHKSRGSGGH